MATTERNAQGVEVLAVLDEAIEDCVWLRGNSIKQMEVTPDDLATARLAIEGLIEAAKKAQAMMAIPERIEPRHRQELCDAIGRCEVVADPRFIPTAADVKMLQRRMQAFEPLFRAVAARKSGAES